MQNGTLTDPVADFVRSNLIAWGALSCVVGAVPAAVLAKAAPKFASLFAGFGADVPSHTLFVLRWSQLLWVLPVIALALFLAALLKPSTSLRRHAQLVKVFAALCCLAVLLGTLAFASLYQPIFRMGAAI
jgi:type II secretory pathway component PulF